MEGTEERHRHGIVLSVKEGHCELRWESSGKGIWGQGMKGLKWQPEVIGLLRALGSYERF